MYGMKKKVANFLSFFSHYHATFYIFASSNIQTHLFFAMIHLENINKTYHNGAPLHVLKGITLDIQKGEFVSIMGASGSGKST